MAFNKAIKQLIVVAGCVACSVAARGQGCQTPPVQGTTPCAPNPVPCAHCTGTWTDNYGWTYTLSSNTNPPAIGTYSVTGTMKASATDCSVVYTVSGTITQTSGGAGAGTTTLDLTGSDPDPAAGYYCPSDDEYVSAEQSVSVNIANNGCNSAEGTWSNSDGGNGSLSMTKPADVPDGNPAQTTSATCWWDQCGQPSDWTVVLFSDTIQSSKAMAGRQAYEWQNYPGNIQDSCWYQNSAYAKGGGGLSGGGWYVGFYYFGNVMDYDYVGMLPAMFAYYNGLNGGLNKVPCSMSIGQNMSLFTYTGSSQYFNDTLTLSIQSGGWYGVAKNGTQAWRQYTCGGGTCNPQ
jgi:hypothetical protein